MPREYHVEPIVIKLEEHVFNREQFLAGRLEDVINAGARNGWTYQGFEAVPMRVSRGCLWFGKAWQETVYIAVFYRDVPAIR